MVAWRPGARPSKHHGLSIESPWNLHGISMESPSNLHRISIESPSRKHRLRSDEDPYIYTRCSESEGLSLRFESLNHRIKDRIEDGGYPARSTAEGVGGFPVRSTAQEVPGFRPPGPCETQSHQKGGVSRSVSRCVLKYGTETGRLPRAVALLRSDPATEGGPGVMPFLGQFRMYVSITCLYF